MCVTHHVLKLCQEFLAETNPLLCGNQVASDEAQDLIDYLTDEVLSAGEDDETRVIEEAQSRITNIWKEIKRGKKCNNVPISRRFDELQEHLSYLIEEVSPSDEDEECEDFLALDAIDPDADYDEHLDESLEQEFEEDAC